MCSYALPAVLGASLYVILIHFSDEEVWTIDSILYVVFDEIVRAATYEHFQEQKKYTAHSNTELQNHTHADTALGLQWQ